MTTSKCEFIIKDAKSIEDAMWKAIADAKDAGEFPGTQYLKKVTFKSMEVRFSHGDSRVIYTFEAEFVTGEESAYD